MIEKYTRVRFSMLNLGPAEKQGRKPVRPVKVNVFTRWYKVAWQTPRFWPPPQKKRPLKIHILSQRKLVSLIIYNPYDHFTLQTSSNSHHPVIMQKKHSLMSTNISHPFFRDILASSSVNFRCLFFSAPRGSTILHGKTPGEASKRLAPPRFFSRRTTIHQVYMQSAFLNVDFFRGSSLHKSCVRSTSTREDSLVFLQVLDENYGGVLFEKGSLIK